MSQSIGFDQEWPGSFDPGFSSHCQTTDHDERPQNKRRRHDENAQSAQQTRNRRTPDVHMTGVTANPPAYPTSQTFIPGHTSPVPFPQPTPSWENEALTYLCAETGFRRDFYHALVHHPVPQDGLHTQPTPPPSTLQPIPSPPRFDVQVGQQHTSAYHHNSRTSSTERYGYVPRLTFQPQPFNNMSPFVHGALDQPFRAHPRTPPRPEETRSPHRHVHRIRRMGGPSSPRRNPQYLILNRVSPEYIEGLDEHKRECPACQLEFEIDNFIATVSCCSTSMHAVCLSAWVNTATWMRSKTCMKCRRPCNDIKRALNKVLPAVSNKAWDKGVNFGVPAPFKDHAEIRIELPGGVHPHGNYMRLTSTPSPASAPFDHERIRTSSGPGEYAEQIQQLQQQARQRVLDPQIGLGASRFANPQHHQDFSLMGSRERDLERDLLAMANSPSVYSSSPDMTRRRNESQHESMY